MAEKNKKIGEVFPDYKTNSNIKYAYVQALKVNKKTNTLCIMIGIDEYIEVKEIWFLEKFLMERFNFGNIDTYIKYTDNVEIKSIQEEWKNVICYMAHKYPLAKPMLLMNADIDVQDNKINVKMHIKGADFLRAKKSDKTLEMLIKNIMGKEYKIEITEDLNQDAIKKIEEEARKAENSVVSKVMESLESAKREQEASKEMAFENEAANGVDPNYMPPSDSDMPYMGGEGMPEDYMPPELPEYEQEQTLILGKATKAKENRVKIKEITPSDARITLEGRVSNVEKRLTKSEKVLLIFELFDGSGTITCKSFTIPDEAEAVIAKLEEANTVKLIGKANLDAYAGDVTVIANTIFQTNNDSIPKKEDVEEEETPLILGFNQNVGEKITKITDLGPEDGKVVLKGEVLNMEPRELKSGKTLLSFDLYDGTSTLTCKAFLNKDQAKKVPKRLKKAKGIKIEGNAGMDNFSGELSVMANTIIEIKI